MKARDERLQREKEKGKKEREESKQNERPQRLALTLTAPPFAASPFSLLFFAELPASVGTAEWEDGEARTFFFPFLIGPRGSTASSKNADSG
jgi:hypothetical protein